jgi:hypothetical protein
MMTRLRCYGSTHTSCSVIGAATAPRAFADRLSVFSLIPCVKAEPVRANDRVAGWVWRLARFTQTLFPQQQRKTGKMNAIHFENSHARPR